MSDDGCVMLCHEVAGPVTTIRSHSLSSRPGGRHDPEACGLHLHRTSLFLGPNNQLGQLGQLSQITKQHSSAEFASASTIIFPNGLVDVQYICVVDEMDFIQSFAPNGPTITVFKGWHSSRVKVKNRTVVGHTAQITPLASLALSCDTAKPKKLCEFGNAGELDLKFIAGSAADRTGDDNVQRLTYSHARNDFVRNPRRQRGFATRCSKISLRISEQTTVEKHDTVVPRLFGFPTALCVSEYPISMQPHFHQLLGVYIGHVTRRLYPIWRNLKFHPSLGPDWYQFAVTDAAMLHGLLYAGAVYSALTEGKTESQDSVYHLSQIVSIISKRLDQSGPIQESTIGTLCCLALGEASTGRLDLWHIHMRGLKQILEARGGISSLPILLQTKVRRTDVAAAAEQAEIPYLDFYRSNQPPIWSILPEEAQESTQGEMASLLTACHIHSDLVANMTELALFTQAIKFSEKHPQILLDANGFSENMHWIQYRFLSFPTSLREGSRGQEIDHACRIGGLLYMRAILEQAPYSTTGASILLRRLQESLDKIHITKVVAPLLLWLALVGAVLSNHDLQRTWYVAHLTLLTSTVPVSSFDDADVSVNRLLGIQDSLGWELKKLWTEVTAIQGLNASYQGCHGSDSGN